MARLTFIKQSYLRVACSLFKHTGFVYVNKHRPLSGSLPVAQTLPVSNPWPRRSNTDQLDLTQESCCFTLWPVGGVSLFSRFLPSDPDAAGRVHPPGSGDPVQQRQGAGPAEPAGQVHEERRYQPSRPTHTHMRTAAHVQGLGLMSHVTPPPPPQMPVRQRSWRRPVPVFLPIATRSTPPLTSRWRTSQWGSSTPTCPCPPITSRVWSRAPASTRAQTQLVSPSQVKNKKLNVMDSSPRPRPFLSSFCVSVRLCPSPPGGQLDFSQVSGPLMTPPISPAALVHRGSVINQGPMAGRLLASSSSSACSSSSSSCLSSLGAMTQPSPCSAYPETLYHCLAQTSPGYFPPASGSSTPSYQPSLRSDMFNI